MIKRDIYLSPLAEAKIVSVLTFLEEEWSEKVKDEYLAKLKIKLNHIAKHPEACPPVRGFEHVRKCQVTKHNALFYTFSDTEVEVVTHFDTRQNPDKVWKELGN